MMGVHVPTEVESILMVLGDGLAEIDRENIRNFLTYGEYVLAVDTLCEQMNERGATPDRAIFERIMNLASGLGMDVALYRTIVPSPRA